MPGYSLRVVSNTFCILSQYPVTLFTFTEYTIIFFNGSKNKGLTSRACGDHAMGGKPGPSIVRTLLLINWKFKPYIQGHISYREFMKDVPSKSRDKRVSFNRKKIRSPSKDCLSRNSFSRIIGHFRTVSLTVRNLKTKIYIGHTFIWRCCLFTYVSVQIYPLKYWHSFVNHI